MSGQGQTVSGDVYLQRRHNNRLLAVLSDGAGSGVKANVTAGVISSMALNYAMADIPAAHAAEVIMRTFSGGEAGASATFTLLDIHQDGEVSAVECGNPPYILLRGGKIEKVKRDKAGVSGDEKIGVSRFKAELEDRIILFSDGVADSGAMTSRLPEGWAESGVASFCAAKAGQSPGISAYDLSREVIARAEMNDMFAPKHDMSCAVVYFRRPRRILICTGPPYKESKDAILADMVARYDGTVLICGGTTAQIVSRELGRPITMDLGRDPAGLPPTSSMDGVELITEGVLTLSKVKSLLENLAGNDVTQKGTDGVVARMLLGHDVIEFEVGTRINPVHQDPNLPVELELRRNLIKGLGALLETKFMKDVTIKYI